MAWGQGNDQDYDLESGDDIALSGIGVQRFEGMFGFDWASAKYDVAGVNWDFNIPIFTSAPADILRDRFDLMEGMSGWIHNDTLLGDNRGGTVGDTDAAGSFDDHVLTAVGIDRINGLRNWFDGALETLGGPGATSFRDGNLIMGGAGSDRMMGRGGFDVIDDGLGSLDLIVPSRTVQGNFCRRIGIGLFFVGRNQDGFQRIADDIRRYAFLFG